MKVQCPQCNTRYPISIPDNHIATIICDYCETHFDISLVKKKWWFFKTRTSKKRDNS